jgi:hypothetical protein
MRVGGGRGHGGEGTGDKSEQSGQDNEALHGTFPQAMDDGQLPGRRTLLTRMVALTVGPTDRGVILHMEEGSISDGYFRTYFWMRQFSVSATKISSRGDTAM